MKQYILLVSLGAAGIATVLGLTSIIANSDFHLVQLAFVFGLFSIASFFVGLAYPVTKIEISSQSYDDVNKTTTDTRKVINS